MTITGDTLYALLPAVYRTRDAEEGFPLRELVGVIAEQAAVIEENILQLLDDQFIETCADWVAPYIGGLIGHRPLYGAVARVTSPRAEVANTIRYRRRLGTASVIEQFARDVTGWPARAVEYFQPTATTQRMNHIRLAHHFSPDLRNGSELETVGTAFDPFTRLADMRSIARADGRYNFPNIGVHLWRLTAFAREASPATEVDALRHLFSPLGAPLPLYTNPDDEPEITHLATPLNVPGPITRRALHADQLGQQAIYGRNAADALQSVRLLLDGVPLGADEVEACNLSDDGADWANMPAVSERIAIDPVIGRIALPPDRPGVVTVDYHYGFSALIGGGPYERARRFAAATDQRPLLRVPGDHATIQDALDALPADGGIVEITDNRRYEDAVAIAAGPGAAVELRAANGINPHLRLNTGLTIIGGDSEARVTIDGLLISGARVSVPDVGGNALGRLILRHCTLVPGLALDAAGQPLTPGAGSLEVAVPGCALEMEACITGRIGVASEASASLTDSIVDSAAVAPADSREGVAYADPAGDPFGGPLSLRGVTLFGRVAAERFDFVSDSIFHSRLPAGSGWQTAVWAERRQAGCVRFSFVPRGAIVPRRFRCQPQLAIDQEIEARAKVLGGPVPAAERAAIAIRIARRMVPSFTARRYGRPAYPQLRRTTPQGIREGASDGGEMGAFHLNFGPHRETNLKIRLEEYLRFALEAGVFFES